MTKIHYSFYTKPCVLHKLNPVDKKKPTAGCGNKKIRQQPRVHFISREIPNPKLTEINNPVNSREKI